MLRRHQITCKSIINSRTQNNLCIYKVDGQCSMRIWSVMIINISMRSWIKFSALNFFKMHNLCTLSLHFAHYPENTIVKIPAIYFSNFKVLFNDTFSCLFRNYVICLKSMCENNYFKTYILGSQFKMTSLKSQSKNKWEELNTFRQTC